MGTGLSAAARSPHVPADAARRHSTAPPGPVAEQPDALRAAPRAGRAVVDCFFPGGSLIKCAARHRSSAISTLSLKGLNYSFPNSVNTIYFCVPSVSLGSFVFFALCGKANPVKARRGPVISGACPCPSPKKALPGGKSVVQRTPSTACGRNRLDKC